MINRKSISFLLLIFYYGCNGGGQEPEALPPTVSLSVSSSSILVGDSLTLHVDVADIESFYAVSFEIMYDYNILEIDMESGVLSYNQFTGDNFGPLVYTDDGILSFVLGGNNINGKIFSATIIGLQVGITNIELNNVNLIQEDGTDVPNYNLLKLSPMEITVTSE